MSEVIKKEDIKGIECRFVVYLPPTKEMIAANEDATDYHLVKEVVHTNDGRQIQRVRYIKNFRRPYYITQKRYRDHEQKREKELLERCDKWEVKQYQLQSDVMRKLRMKGNPRYAMESPYLYGTDLTSTAYMKGLYKRRYPDAVSFFNVAVFDTETNIEDNTIIVASLTFKDKAVVAVRSDWLGPISMPEKQILDSLNFYMREHIEKRNIKFEIVVVDKEIDIVREIFKRAHEWSPDFIAVWNLEFDIDRTVAACNRAKVDPVEIFNDPRTPKGYEFFKFNRAPRVHTSNDGKVTNLSPHERWNYVECSAGFVFIDAMVAYYLIRIHLQNEQSYKLDAILDKEIKMTKMKFEEANHLSGDGILWHRFMQRSHKLAYIAYNVWDCISMELLDEATLDLCLSLPNASALADFTKFDSQPLRNLPMMYWYLIDNGYVFANAAGMKTELDELVTGLKGWIVTMPAHLLSVKGLKCLA